MAEDEVVVAEVGGAAPLLLEDGERAWAELDDPPRRPALGRREPAAHERLPDLDLRFEQVDGAPAEADQLAAAKGRPEGRKDIAFASDHHCRSGSDASAMSSS
jgi:hypothetical protein